MYLRKSTYIAARYEHRNVKAKIEITIGDKPINIDPEKVYEITEDVGYWRKANAIHAWFVKNVQDGNDNCAQYDVSYEQLLELKKLCKKVIRTRDATPLPPTAGFFFGSTEADEYYFSDLKETVKMIDALDPNGEYLYRASW